MQPLSLTMVSHVRLCSLASLLDSLMVSHVAEWYSLYTSVVWVYMHVFYHKEVQIMRWMVTNKFIMLIL